MEDGREMASVGNDNERGRRRRKNTEENSYIREETKNSGNGGG